MGRRAIKNVGRRGQKNRRAKQVINEERKEEERTSKERGEGA